MSTQIHAKGDIILFTKAPDSKPELKRLLVHSHFLSQASPVFQRMFSGEFVESQGLSALASRAIKLDDDPKALFTHTKLIHLCHKGLAISPTAEELYNLAVVVDKYDCYDAVSITMSAWLHTLDTTTQDAKDWAPLAGAYGVLGQRRGYWDWTAKLILSFGGSYVPYVDREILMLGPGRLVSISSILLMMLLANSL